MSKRIKFLASFLLFSLLLFGCATEKNQPPVNIQQSGANEQTKQPEQSNQPEQIKTTETPSNTGLLKIHFIDVGQADSILIQGPKGQAVLIDGGNNDDASTVVDYLKKQGVKELDAVVATHPHEDHIGGLDVVIKTFPVKIFYMPNVSSTTKTFKDLIIAVQASSAKKVQAKLGVRLEVPEIDAVFMAPCSDKYQDLNDYSAVLKLTYGKTSFLLTGDAEKESEEAMLVQSQVSPKADLLKIGHHGSSSSTSATFLKLVAPKYAVISVGKGNDYGHPHKETLTKLANAGIQVFRTDEAGTIIATSDGEIIKLDKQASPVKPNAPPSFVTPKPSC